MKDALGHGSDSRGGVTNRGGDYHNIDRNLRGAGKHVGYADGPWHIQKYGGGATTYMGTHVKSGANVYGRTLGEVSAKLASREKLATGNVSPQAATNAMHTAHVVSGGHDATFRGNGEDRRGWKLHLDKQTGATVWGKP